LPERDAEAQSCTIGISAVDQPVTVIVHHVTAGSARVLGRRRTGRRAGAVLVARQEGSAGTSRALSDVPRWVALFGRLEDGVPAGRRLRPGWKGGAGSTPEAH